MDNFNLTSGIPTLPPPDQTGGSMAQPGTTGTPTPAADKTMGSISGVSASKGASDAVGVNSLIVDPQVQGAMSTSGLSEMGMDAASVLGAAPASIDPQSMVASLGNVADDLDNISSITNTFASDVSGLAGSGSVEGKIKGDGGADGAKKGGKAEGKGKGGAGSSEPTAGSSVSRAESPTGETITTVTSETVSSSGAVITNTSTTMSGGDAPPAKDGSGSGGSTGSTGSTETTPPPDDGCNLSTIMAEMGELTNQESLTMAQQQTSMIDAISLQASDTMAQAAAMTKGAYMMMSMATVGLSVSMATAAYSASAVGAASAEGDDAETASMSEQETALNSSAKQSSRITDDALSTKDPATIAKAKVSISETRTSAELQCEKGNITEEQRDSITAQMDANSAALKSAEAGYKTGDPVPTGWTRPKDEAGNFLKNPDGTDVSNPQEAAAAYNAQAKTIQSDREASGTSMAQLSKLGIKPGSKVSDEDAEKAIKSSWSDDQNEQYKKAVDSGDTATQAKMLTKPAATFKTNVANLKTNKNSSAWHQAYQNKLQQSQIYAGVGTALAQTMNGVGNMENELYQAKGTKDSAAAQVEGSTVQSMSSGISNTESVAQQIRSNLAAVAQDMSTMVSSTRV
ncbi:MAG: hypothetical protein K2W97_05155 [Chthoniobacterales bacterium]|nr:hypothetical protein [Chthoniobacterales bacterium]